MDVMDAATKRRRADMRARVKADLARRGIGNPDLKGVSGDTDFEAGGGEATVIHGWTLTVHMTRGRELTYRQRNVDGAPLYCDGVPVPDFKPEN